MQNINEEVARSLSLFQQQYSIITSYQLESQERIIIGKDKFICRFCGRSKPEAKFKTIAHAIPEFTGNKTLFSNIECDECNAKFGRTIENDMANAMNLGHSVLGIKGKVGIPKFKQTNGSRIETINNQINWTGVNNSAIKQNGSALTIKNSMHSFVPMAFYKCLVKMALTIMPEEEMQHFGNSVNWINDLSNSVINTPLYIHTGTIKGGYRFPHISAILCKRNDLSDSDFPYMYFRLTYGVFLFQIPVPFSNMHPEILQDSSKLIYIPSLIDALHGFEMSTISIDDFNNIEQSKSEMTFEIENLDK